MAPHPHSPTPAAQFTQFLNNVLSQRGPSSLPYTEDVKWLIRQQLLTLIENYPSLQPKTATFTHNDGRTVNLLQIDGTIPMIYQNVTYNIPIIIWLMESYPRHPPCVYVAPTNDMVIKRPHPHVNPSGLVSIPYLHNWVYPSSNLVELVRNLSHLFGRDPPLYTRQQSQSRPSPPSSVSQNENNPNPRSGLGQGNYSRPPAAAAAAAGAIPPRGYSSLPSPYGGRYPQSPQRQQSTDDPEEVFKKNAINKLLERVFEDAAALRKQREAENEGLFSTQAVLRQREEQLNNGLREMTEEKEGLEQQLQMILMNTDILEIWLNENGGNPAMKNGDVDIENVFEPCDVLSKQMIECNAADLAIEDVIYSLDKAVQAGSIPFDQYLKNVRMLSREQFFHRATASKVRAAQMQAQVASMAARAPHYAM